MTDLDDAYRALQIEYLAEGPSRLVELRDAATRLSAGESEALDTLATGLHRLAGSGGSYGFPEISAVAREAEQWIRGAAAWTRESDHQLGRAIERLARAFDAAARSLGVGHSPGGSAGPGWQAHVVGPGGVRRDSVVGLLTSSGFAVTSEENPVHSEVTWRVAGDRPDLVVLLDGEHRMDVFATAMAWTVPHKAGPRGLVLISGRAEEDQFRLGAAGIDAVYSPESARVELPRFAKAVASIGNPPFRVLVVEDDLDQAQVIASSLEAAQVVVLHEADPAAAEEVLREERLDLVLLDVTLPDRDAFAVADRIRNDPRMSSVPLVFLAEEAALPGQLQRLRTEADDFLLKPIEAVHHHHLIQVVLTRAERGRRTRQMSTRDGLTGFLNHAAFMCELTHATKAARRRGQTLALLLIDVDHFGRFNDAHGYVTGDRALLHLADMLHATVHGKHVMARMGGDEFGLILHSPTCEAAAAAAATLRGTIESHPFRAPGGGIDLSLRVSLGMACLPADGEEAGELAEAAGRALARAKLAAGARSAS